MDECTCPFVQGGRGARDEICPSKWMDGWMDRWMYGDPFAKCTCRVVSGASWGGENPTLCFRSGPVHRHPGALINWSHRTFSILIKIRELDGGKRGTKHLTIS